MLAWPAQWVNPNWNGNPKHRKLGIRSGSGCGTKTSGTKNTPKNGMRFARKRKLPALMSIW
eukprot:8153797-Lingulodinium_polyedra.AAC.1